MYMNEDAFFNKRSELLQPVQIEAPDLMCFTEILPKNSSHSVEIFALQMEGYDCFKKTTSCS